MKDLGYGPLAIAHAFSTLTGPGTVTEALAELAQHAQVERSMAVALDFETVEQEPGLPPGHSLTITGAERDGYGIRIRYAIHPPLPVHVGRPHSEARDDCDHARRPRRIRGSRETSGPQDRRPHDASPTAMRLGAARAHQLVKGIHPTVGAAGAGITDHALSD
jgi:hypothetical protein